MAWFATSNGVGCIDQQAMTLAQKAERYELEIDPEIWFVEDDGYELAVFHSHPETEPIPSRTDQELSGLWGGRTFLIYGVKLDQLRAWQITRESFAELPLG